MKCYDFDSNSCCNFYNLSGDCVAACSADSQPNENFVCTGMLFSVALLESLFHVLICAKECMVDIVHCLPLTYLRWGGESIYVRVCLF